MNVVFPHPTSTNQCWPRISDARWGGGGELLAAICGLEWSVKVWLGEQRQLHKSPSNTLSFLLLRILSKGSKVGLPTQADLQILKPPSHSFRVFILFSNLFWIFKLGLFTLNFGVELDISLAKYREVEGPDVGSMYTGIFTCTLDGFLF